MPDPGEIRVIVADNGLSATLSGAPEEGQDANSLKRILLEAIRSATILRGLDDKAVEEAFKLLAEGKPVQDLVIARGVPPEPGTDGRIEHLIQLESPESGLEDQRGHIDFKDKGELPVVNPDQVLAREIPPQAGKPGVSVTGKPLKPLKPEPRRLRLGRNVAREGEEIKAKIRGVVVRPGPDELDVMAVLDLEAVDHKSGHVKFPGLVRVAGSIETGFKVQTDDLIAGSIEPDAEINVTNSVQVSGAILGAEIRAGGSVSAHLIRQSQIVCGHSLTVVSEIVHSTVKAGHYILVTASEGRIINSQLSVGKFLETGHILSTGKNPSRVKLSGPDVPGLLDTDEVVEAKAKLADLTMAREELALHLSDLGKVWRATKDKEIAAEIKVKGPEFTQLKKDEAAAREELAELERTADRGTPGRAYLTVRGRAEPGLTISGMAANMTLDKEFLSFSAWETERSDPQTGRLRWIFKFTEPKLQS
jgi:uncharacterized protein (DUF342 family)